MRCMGDVGTPVFSGAGRAEGVVYSLDRDREMLIGGIPNRSDLLLKSERSDFSFLENCYYSGWIILRLICRSRITGFRCALVMFVPKNGDVLWIQVIFSFMRVGEIWIFRD